MNRYDREVIEACRKILGRGDNEWLYEPEETARPRVEAFIRLHNRLGKMINKLPDAHFASKVRAPLPAEKPKPKKPALTTKLRESPCCKAPWLWHQLQGVRLWRQVGARKILDARCRSCGKMYCLDDGKAPRED